MYKYPRILMLSLLPFTIFKAESSLHIQEELIKLIRQNTLSVEKLEGLYQQLIEKSPFSSPQKPDQCVMTYNEILIQDRSIHNPAIQKVIELKPNQAYQLQNQRGLKKTLLHLTHLDSIKKLDLKKQGIDDDFVEALCENAAFSRLTIIDLSDNPLITQKSLENILNSIWIGCRQDLFHKEEQYDAPAAEIKVYVKGTGISETMAHIYNNTAEKMNFKIQYRHATTHKAIAYVPNSRKLVKAIL